MTRRIFVKIAGAIMFLASIPSFAFGLFVNTLLIRTVEKTRFKFNASKGLIEWETGAKEWYGLIVDGLVKEPKNFSYADLWSFSQVEQIADFHCVEGWSVKGIKWGGFRFKEILERIQPAKDATHVLFHSLGTTENSPKGQSHYIESLPISELLDPARKIILVLNLNDKPLLEEHGAPLRVISPYDLGYKSIKFVNRIEFIKGERPGWWTLANPKYSVKARVPQDRLN